MGYVKFQKIHYTKSILNFFFTVVKISLLLLSEISLAESEGLLNKLIPYKECFSVFFVEKAVFDGEYKTYRGVFIKTKENSWKIIYETKPVFKIVVTGDTIQLGYEGEDSEIFDRREYKNPILEILFHLENPEKIFEFKPLGKDAFLLIPKGDLANYIRRGKLFLRNEKPYIIEIESGEDNRVTILLENIVPQCD